MSHNGVYRRLTHCLQIQDGVLTGPDNTAFGMFSDPLWRRVTTMVTGEAVGVTIAADTPERRLMVRLVHTQHALDVYLA